MNKPDWCEYLEKAKDEAVRKYIIHCYDYSLKQMAKDIKRALS